MLKKSKEKQKSLASRLPIPGPGRPKGLKNKEYPFLRDMRILYDEEGGVKGLRKFIKQSPRNMAIFYKAIIEMAQKQLPQEHEHSGEIKTSPLIVRVVFVKDGDKGNGGNGDKK
jgi:hypothetical protein